MREFIPKELPLDFEISKENEKQLIKASRSLSRLNGVANIIPNQNILINSLILQEAKDSSEIENIITTHNDIFMANVDKEKLTQSAKEVISYELAMRKGYSLIKKDELFLNKHILEVQKRLEKNNAGFRSQSGTVLKNPTTGEIKHIPPQDIEDIKRLMSNLEKYINEDLDGFDPLIKVAIIHYQFETIHPFYDGNGRVGRIINILYLIYVGLLDLPILYLSGYIIKNKSKYYELLQKLRVQECWNEWIEYILIGIEQTSENTIKTIYKIDKMIKETSEIIIQSNQNIYSKDFVEILFSHPYTKIESVHKKLNISRQTASKYLQICEELGILKSIKLGRFKFFINVQLVELFKQGIC